MFFLFVWLAFGFGFGSAAVAVPNGAPFCVTLGLSKRLVVSQAVGAGMEVKDAEAYSDDEVVRLAQSAIAIIDR